jgi:predicted N-acyltransferase
VLTNRQRRDIRRLHREFRNNFIHFMLQGWSIEKAVLPRIIAAALDAAEALMRRDYVTRLLDVDRQQRLQERVTVALAAARADLPSNIRASD